jgi:hypothetical protein
VEVIVDCLQLVLRPGVVFMLDQFIFGLGMTKTTAILF